MTVLANKLHKIKRESTGDPGQLKIIKSRAGCWSCMPCAITTLSKHDYNVCLSVIWSFPLLPLLPNPRHLIRKTASLISGTPKVKRSYFKPYTHAHAHCQVKRTGARTCTHACTIVPLPLPSLLAPRARDYPTL